MSGEKYYKRIIQTTKSNSFFLFGPRGTGKTSWLKKNFKDALYFDLLDSATYRKLLANPESLSKLIPNGFNNWIIIDEIQRIPELLNEAHRLIENKKYKFILTGSNARKLRKKGINLLAGRAYTYEMHPLSAAELKKDFSLKKSLKTGHLPKAYTADDPKKFLSSYIKTYLREEVAEEGLTRNLGDFYRFLEVASFSQGEALNIAEVTREAELKRDTAESYFNILDDLLIAARIPVFGKRSKRVLLKRNKFYFFDVGVFRELRPTGPLDSESELDGPALETLVLQELRAINEYNKLNYKIYYWRTKTGLEVDFALYGENGLVAIEVKRKKSFSKKDFRGLRAFKKDYPEAKCYMFCNTQYTEYHGDVTVIPITEAIKNIAKILK
ncbi:ATP-binding protein [Candidatus Parcubacteria bacterium]|nr:ATP-binding protein [Candidatus Parcubacteria bacterium]